MALTQEQVDAWFAANPNATADEVAAAVQSVGGLDANEGLAGMIANRYSIAEPEVTNYYNAFTTPVDTPDNAPDDTPTPPASVPTFTDAIVNPPTTQDDFLNTISTPVTPPADNITNSGLTRQAGQMVIEGDDIETQIAQLPTEYASWGGNTPGYTELIRKSDGAVLDRRKLGTLTDEALLKIGLSFIPGAAPFLAAYNALDAARKGDIVGAVIGGTGLVPGMENLNTALKVGKAVDDKNIFGAITTLAGNADVQKLTGLGDANVGGFTAKDATAAVNLAKAAGDGNTAGVLTSLGTLTGSSDTVLAGKALDLIKRLQNGDTRALADAVSLTNTFTGGTGNVGSTSTTAPEITTLSDEDLAELNAGELNAYKTGGIDGLSNFRKDMKLLTSLTTSGRTGDDTGGGDLTTTGTDTVTGGTGTDTVTGATGTDTVTGATGTDTTNIFSKSLGALDELDTTRTADDFADFLKTIGITNATQLTDSGLSNQDILDMINAGVDTVNVTGTNTAGTITDTTGLDTGPVIPTGTSTPIETVTVVDKKCPPGQVYDEDLKQCVPIKTVDDSCPTGFYKDSTGKCVPIEEVKVDDKKCPPGQVYDEDLKQCVPIKTVDDSCPTGYYKDSTGKCVPIETVKIDDKKCATGYVYDEAQKKCVPIETVTVVDKKCPPGQVYDEDLKQCVPIETVTVVDKNCPPGQVYDEDLKQCVPVVETPTTPTTLSCPEGYEPNAAGTACIPVVTIVDKKCPPGQVYDEDLKQCVPIKTDECAPGFEKVNGVCVPVCKEGYTRNLATGACEKVEDKACPPGQVKNAEGKCVPITKVTPPVVVKPPVKKVEVPSFVPSTGSYVSEDKTDPIYAEGMDDFNLFATLEELLADNSDKTDKKKDTKKSKDKTKMATGGHLDDLLAEQMTVDDLLNLLR